MAFRHRALPGYPGLAPTSLHLLLLLGVSEPVWGMTQLQLREVQRLPVSSTITQLLSDKARGAAGGRGSCAINRVCAEFHMSGEQSVKISGYCLRRREQPRRPTGQGTGSEEPPAWGVHFQKLRTGRWEWP